MLPIAVHHPATVWPQLQHLLTTYGIGSTRYTVIDERTHKKVTGVLLQFGDVSRVKTWPLFLDILTLFIHAKVPLRCATTFDKAVGIKTLRDAIERGESLELFKKISTESAHQFFHTTRPFFLYHPHPHVE